MQHSDNMAKDGFGWGFFGGMAFGLSILSFIHWMMLVGPGASLNNVFSAVVILMSFPLASYGFVLFTKIQNKTIHKIMAFTYATAMAVAMITVMLFSDAWSLEKALGIS